MSENSFRIECECGCGDLLIQKLEGDDSSIFLSYNIPAFYAYQSRWKEKLKMLWHIITGKEYAFYELVIPKEKFQEFKDFVNTKL